MINDGKYRTKYLSFVLKKSRQVKFGRENKTEMGSGELVGKGERMSEIFRTKFCLIFLFNRGACVLPGGYPNRVDLNCCGV